MQIISNSRLKTSLLWKEIRQILDYKESLISLWYVKVVVPTKSSSRTVELIENKRPSKCIVSMMQAANPMKRWFACYISI